MILEHLASGFAVSKLAERHAPLLGSFSCGHADSDEFVHKDIFAYQKENIGVSYLLQGAGGEVLSIISVGMGAVRFPDSIALGISVSERPRQLPALKIGRLCTGVGHQKKGYATILLQFATALAIELSQRVGCRYLLVDAYPDKIGFYKQNGFQTFLDDFTGRETIPMYLRLP